MARDPTVDIKKKDSSSKKSSKKHAADASADVEATPVATSTKSKKRKDRSDGDTKPKKVKTSTAAADSRRSGSPEPYKLEDDLLLTKEERKAIEDSLKPERLAQEHQKQLDLLASLMDASGDISVKAKIKKPSLPETRSKSASSAVVDSADHSASDAPLTSSTPIDLQKKAKSKARLALLQQAQQHATSDTQHAGAKWQPTQRFDPSAAVAVQPTIQAEASGSESSDEGAAADEISATAAPPVKLNSLKDMFKPKEAEAGFSLSDMLNDADLDEGYDPFAAFKPAEEPDYEAMQHQAESSRAKSQHAAMSRNQQHVKAADVPLFFAYCFDDDQNDFIKSLNLTQEQKNQLESRSWTSGSGRRFNQLGSREDVIKRHEEMRPRLTEQVRKRHREAVRKVQRRRGA